MLKKTLFIVFLWSFVFINAQNGKVGINTETPTETLDVNGTFRVRKIPLAGNPSNPSIKDSIMVFDNDGVVKYTSANKILSLADAGNVKVLTDGTLKGDGTTGNVLGIAQQGATNGQVLTWNGTSWIPQTAAPVTTTNNLTSSGNILTSNVNGVSSTAPIVNINTLNLTGNNLSTSVNGVASSNVDLTPYLDNTDSQNLSISGNNLSISGGNSITLPVADGSETKVTSGTNINVTGTGTTSDPYVVNNTFTEVDGSTTNELNTAVSTSVNTLTVTDAGGSLTAPIVNSNTLNLTSNNLSTSVNGVASSNVDLSTYLDNTDSQNLTISGNNLSISGGNSVTLPITDGSETIINSGTNINVTGVGTIANPYIINNTYTLPNATSSVLGGVKIGSGINVAGDGTISTVNNGTVTNVTGTAPISVANGTTTPVISLTRNNLNTAASSNTETSPITIINGSNAVVNGADTSLAINNTAPLWNANQLQGINLSNTAPTNGQILKYNGTNWAPTVEAAASNWLITGNSNTTSSNFLGTTNDVLMSIRSNNTSMLEVGRRQTVGLYDSSSTGLFPYNQPNASVTYVRGTGGVSALQFEASGANFYKPIFFTDSNGNFMMRGSCAGTDFFELGSAGASNAGQLIFTIGDDGDEPMIFRKYNYSPVGYVEMMRLQGTGLNNNVRAGINVNGSTPNSTLQVSGSVSAAIASVSATTTLDETYYTVILTNNSTITLPTASTCKGRIYIIKKTATGTSTISSFINSLGNTVTSINSGVYQLQSDGTNWQQIN